MQFENFGGFDALYLKKCLACGIPTSVHLMWIHMSELSLYQQFLLFTLHSFTENGPLGTQKQNKQTHKFYKSISKVLKQVSLK